MLTGRLCGGTRVTSLPSSTTRPSVGRMKPARMRRSVVLPQPEGPSSVTSSPSRISSETSSSAVDLARSGGVTPCDLEPGARRSPPSRLREERADVAPARRAPPGPRRRTPRPRAASVIAMSSVEIVLIDGSTVRRRLDQMNMRERRVGPDHEERDDELVEREREGERGRADEHRPDLRQRHPPEHDPRRGAEVGRRLLERTGRAGRAPPRRSGGSTGRRRPGARAPR